MRQLRPAGEHNLPLSLTSLVGRGHELERLAEVLRRTRLVTVTGPGGVGKTRLALELARGQVARHPGGVWFVDFVAATGPSDVAGEVARALGVSAPSTVATTDALCRYLRSRDLLLVLDNCEHLADASARLAARLLTSAGDVRILATSREPLGVTGETIWRLEPLGSEDAYRLFVERARQRRPGFIPGGETDQTIARLCASLDHLPLAIELAAARLDVMSVDEILAGLKPRLATLGEG